MIRRLRIKMTFYQNNAKEGKDVPKELFSAMIYRLYKEKRLLIACLLVLLYVVFSMILDFYAEDIVKQPQFAKVLYHELIALQNICIALFSIFILYYLIAINYKVQLNEDVKNILTTPILIKDFVKKNQEVLHYRIVSSDV